MCTIKMETKNIPKADELTCNLLVLPNKIVNFEKIGILMIMKSPITDQEYAVQKAKYLGEGNWEAINKIMLKKKVTAGGSQQIKMITIIMTDQKGICWKLRITKDMYLGEIMECVEQQFYDGGSQQIKRWMKQ